MKIETGLYFREKLLQHLAASVLVTVILRQRCAGETHRYECGSGQANDGCGDSMWFVVTVLAHRTPSNRPTFGLKINLAPGGFA